MRWYCWVIFCAIVVFSAWSLPTDDLVNENTLSTVEGENDNEVDTAIDNRLLNDDDDDELVHGLIDEDESITITDRHHRQRKPKDSDESEDDDSDEDKVDKKDKPDKKGKKKPKVTKCYCFEPKRNKHKPRCDSKKPEKDKKPSSSPVKDSSKTPQNEENQKKDDK